MSFLLSTICCLYKNIRKDFTSGREKITCWTDLWHHIPLLRNLVLGTSAELGKYKFYQILKYPQLRLKSHILLFAFENSVQFSLQERYFKSGIFKAITTIMFSTRLCLTNECDCSDLLSFSQMPSFSPPVPLIKDVMHISLHKTGNESATIDLCDFLQMLRHHWVVTWAANCFKAAQCLKYSFPEKKSAGTLFLV